MTVLKHLQCTEKSVSIGLLVKRLAGLAQWDGADGEGGIRRVFFEDTTANRLHSANMTNPGNEHYAAALNVSNGVKALLSSLFVLGYRRPSLLRFDGGWPRTLSWCFRRLSYFASR